MPESDFIEFRALYRSPMISVHDYVCQHTACGQTPEEQSDANSVTLLRYGAFSRHFGKRQVTADVNQAVFFSKDSVYRVSHPSDCGDRGTSFIVAASILTDIVRELDPTVDERPDQPFLFVSAPCSTPLFWRHREFVRRLESAADDPLEPLWADVTGLQLIADVLEAAFDQRRSKPRKRRSTLADHAERTEAAKVYLAARMTEPVTLDEVAAAVNSSPFNFARIFHEQTGLPLHRYLTILRLRDALERVADPTLDLSAIAFELGFSSHSHFTDVFRREFGKTPSEVRNLSRKTRDEMSKNLIA